MASRALGLAKMFEDKAKALTLGDQRIAQGLASSRGRSLSTANLITAGIDRSTNPLLQTIWEEVQLFNERGLNTASRNAAEDYQLAVQLDGIYYWSMQYATSKWAFGPGQPDKKRSKRYIALKQLLDEVIVAFERLGLKTMTGTTDFAKISNTKRDYWLERIDPQNRPGYFLSPMYAKWQTLKPAGAGGKPVDFFTWLNSWNVQSNLNYAEARENIKKVQNYDANEPLWNYIVSLGPGQVSDVHNNIFTTQPLRTEFSGNGWAIFVASGSIPTRTGGMRSFLFSGTHDAGRFHHSSFLSGASAVAAGEWIVDNAGRILVITAKSGHYKPTPQNMLQFVRNAKHIPSDAIIRPDLGDMRGGGAMKFYRVGDFSTSGLDAVPLKRDAVKAKFPGWANLNVTEPGHAVTYLYNHVAV